MKKQILKIGVFTGVLLCGTEAFVQAGVETWGPSALMGAYTFWGDVRFSQRLNKLRDSEDKEQFRYPEALREKTGSLLLSNTVGNALFHTALGIFAAYSAPYFISPEKKLFAVGSLGVSWAPGGKFAQLSTWAYSSLVALFGSYLYRACIQPRIDATVALKVVKQLAVAEKEARLKRLKELEQSRCASLGKNKYETHVLKVLNKDAEFGDPIYENYKDIGLLGHLQYRWQAYNNVKRSLWSDLERESNLIGTLGKFAGEKVRIEEV